MEHAPVPTLGGRHRNVAAARPLPVALLLISMLGSAACGSGAEPANGDAVQPFACSRLERVFATTSDTARRREVVHEVLSALGGPAQPHRRGVPPGQWVPRSLWRPASILARAQSVPPEDVEAALLEVGHWFGVECVGPTVVDGPDDRRLLPRPPPAHLPLCFAMDTAEALGVFPARRGTSPAGRWAVWGDASDPDPWSGSLVSLTTSPSDRVPVHDDALPATVRGRAALVAPGPLFQAVSSAAWGHVVSWQERPGLVAEVAYRRGSPADAVRVAEVVRFDGDRAHLPDDALGRRTRLLFDGMPPSPLGVDLRELWAVAYGTGQQQIRVLGRTPVEGALRALEFWTVRSEPLTIRGRAAILYAAFDADSGPWGVAWTERDGLIVQVIGFAPQEAIVEVASSLVDVSPAEWRAAKADVERCADDTP